MLKWPSDLQITCFWFDWLLTQFLCFKILRDHSHFHRNNGNRFQVRTICLQSFCEIWMSSNIIMFNFCINSIRQQFIRFIPSDNWHFVDSRYNGRRMRRRILFVFIIICESSSSSKFLFLFLPNQRENSLILMTIIIRLPTSKWLWYNQRQQNFPSISTFQSMRLRKITTKNRKFHRSVRTRMNLTYHVDFQLRLWIGLRQTYNNSRRTSERKKLFKYFPELWCFEVNRKIATFSCPYQWIVKN